MIISFLIFVFLYLPNPFNSGEVCWSIIFVIFIFPIIGYLIGYKIENKGDIKLGDKKLAEIKQLLIERKSLTEVEEKIESWKQQGYDVSELEKMIKDTQEKK